MDSTNKNPLDELLEAVGRDTLPWDRDVEPAIAGQVVNLDERHNEYGMFPIVTIVTGDGREVEIAGMGAVLNRAIMTSGIQPTDYIAVRYLGQRTPRSGGKQYHDFKVVVRDSNGDPKRRDQATAAPAKDIAQAVDMLEQGFGPLPGEEPF